MKPVFKAFVFILLPAVVLMVLGTAIFVGFGALLARWLPLSLFQASGLTIGSTLALAASIHVITTVMRSSYVYDFDDDVEDEEDDWDPIDVSPIEPDFSKASRNNYCPCGSGKKFKNCCENKTVK